MNKLYDVSVTRQHIDTKEIKDLTYQVVGDDITHAVFCAGQVYHNDQYDILHLFVSGVSVLNHDFYEWSPK